jgi:hypothetical protein
MKPSPLPSGEKERVRGKRKVKRKYEKNSPLTLVLSPKGRGNKISLFL